MVEALASGTRLKVDEEPHSTPADTAKVKHPIDLAGFAPLLFGLDAPAVGAQAIEEPSDVVWLSPRIARRRSFLPEVAEMTGSWWSVRLDE